MSTPSVQAPADPGCPAWLPIAFGELGQRELAGAAHNARIIAYHATTTLKATSDEVAWCSAFLNWVMRQAGKSGTGSAAARSWLKWGVTLPSPRLAAVAVLWRGDPASDQGHVGIVVGFDRDHVWLLGGNQGDAVTVARFPRGQVLGFRWP